MMFRRIALLIYYAGMPLLMLAQPLGLRSPATRYAQIHTDTIRVIFPQGLESNAQRVAAVATRMARDQPLKVGSHLRKIDILLQNATTIPNGYVGLAPWRSEFYLTPPQNSFEIGSLPWQDLLTIHEFRHVQQLSAARYGISELIYYLFGGDAYSGAVHLSVPNWYIEGDAVVAETALTRQGRGRLPSFINGYRAAVEDGRYWSYAQARNGSLREYIPSHYPLGYLLVNYGREQYGQQFWNEIMLEAAEYKSLFYSFSAAMKRRSGLNTRQFYNSAMEHYRHQWSDAGKSSEAGQAGSHGQALVHEEDDRFRDMSYPVFDNDGTMYAVIESFDKIPAIYSIDQGAAKKVTTPGFQTEPVIDAAAGLLCWSEMRRHPRWIREDYSVIVIYNIDKGQKRVLRGDGNYYMPALSANGSRILALHDNGMQEFHLHILSSANGEILRVLPNPDNLFLTFPQWSEDGEHVISAARLGDGRMAVISQNLSDGMITWLTDPGYAPAGRPYIHGEWTYFSMSAGLADEIFRVHIHTGELQQLTHDGASKYQPVVDKGSGDLLFTRFTLRGKKLTRLPFTHITPVHVKGGALRGTHVEAYEHDLLSGAGTGDFEIKKYPMFARPLRIHSWRPYADDPVYRFTMLSENTLSTILWTGGWHYNRNTNDHGPYTDLVLGMWYPEIVAGYEGTKIRRIHENQVFRWWSHTMNAGVRIPYYGVSGPYSQFGALSTRINRLRTSGDVDFSFSYLSHALQFVNERRRALQHPVSRFSQTVVLRYAHAIDTVTANQLMLSAQFAFPSPVRNHVLWCTVDYRYEPVQNALRFGDIFPYGRGFRPLDVVGEIPTDDHIWRLGINYQLPLVYPDIGIAGLVYFRRVRLNAFFDFMQTRGSRFTSAGAELYFDVNLFNVEPYTIGFRWAETLDPALGRSFSVILPVLF